MARHLSDQEYADIQRGLDELKARKEAKEAERKARWDRYYEQLAKATPFTSGGAKRINRNRRARTFRFGKDN